MRRMNSIYRAALAMLCSLTMICGGLAPITANAAEAAVVIVGTNLDAGNNYTYSDGNGGTAVYSPSTNTLTLKDLSVNDTTDKEAPVKINKSMRIKVVGNNTITATNMNAIHGGDGITLTFTTGYTTTSETEGSLNLTSSGKVGILSQAIIFKTCKLTISGTYSCAMQGSSGITVYDGCDLTVTSSGRAGSFFVGQGYNLKVIASDTKSMHYVANQKADQTGTQYAPEDNYTQEDGIWVITIAKSSSILKAKYSHIYSDNRVDDDPEDPGQEGGEDTGSVAQAEDSSYHHQHTYAWETYKAATATTDGIMRYRCTGCGDVEYEVPTAAYYVFNKETQASIQNAAAGATVTVETPIFISFHEMVKEALVARPDVTLVVDYKNAGKTYEMTIPAGSGDTLNTLYGDDQYAGFLYLGGAFATVEK